MRTYSISDIFNNISENERVKIFFHKMYILYAQEIEFGLFKNTNLWSHSVTYQSFGINDKLKFFVDFNIFGFIFGPIYYFYKKIILKGIVLSIILYYCIISDAIISALTPLLFLYCSLLVNRDYFLHKIKTNKQIMSNTDVLSGQPDDIQIEKIIQTERPNYIGVIIFVLILFFSISAVINNYSTNKDTLSIIRMDSVCSTNEDCEKYILSQGYPITTEKQYLNVAKGYYGKKKYIEAEARLLNATKINPRNYDAYILLGNCFFETGQYNNALTAYKQALKINGKLIRLNYNIGRCYYRLKKYNEAIKFLTLAINKYPLNPEYKEIRAYSYIGANSKYAAQKDIKDAIRIYSATPLPAKQRRKQNLERYYKTLSK